MVGAEDLEQVRRQEAQSRQYYQSLAFIKFFFFIQLTLTDFIDNRVLIRFPSQKTAV